MIHRNGLPKTKTRVKSTITAGPVSYRSYSIADGHLLFTGGPYSYTSSSSEDTITSTNRLNSRDGHANACLHTRERTTAPNYTTNYNWYTAANPTVRVEQYDSGSQAAGNLVSAKAAAFSALGVTGKDFLRNNAIPLITANFDSLRPDLTEVSVPNFLLDIGQISSLMKLWKYRRPLVQNLANANLNYQFGWRPTIGDVTGMFNSIRNLQEKIKAFQDRLGKLTTKQKLVASGSVAKSGTISGGYTIRWRAVQTYTCTAHIAYRPLPLKEMTSFERLLKGTLDSWGFELNAEILWDAIPFSFVLDWFLDVGTLARQFRLDTLELPIKLEDCYLQFKETVTVDCDSEETANADHNVRHLPGASYERTVFHRLGAQPNYQSMVWLGWRFPSLNQAILGLSLGLTRR